MAQSYFAEQESVFDAHELGLCTLGTVRGEPERFKPDRHYRMKASRRRAVAAAIRAVGLDAARQAARNLPLDTQLQGGDNSGFHALDIERAFLDPEQTAQLFQGPDTELAEAIRKVEDTGRELAGLGAPVPYPLADVEAGPVTFDELAADATAETTRLRRSKRPGREPEPAQRRAGKEAA